MNQVKEHNLHRLLEDAGIIGKYGELVVLQLKNMILEIAGEACHQATSEVDMLHIIRREVNQL